MLQSQSPLPPVGGHEDREDQRSSKSGSKSSQAALPLGQHKLPGEGIVERFLVKKGIAKGSDQWHRMVSSEHIKKLAEADVKGDG